MPKFEVIIKSTEVYLFGSIEAESEDEAKEEALTVLETRQGKAEHHHDSEGSEEVYEL